VGFRIGACSSDRVSLVHGTPKVLGEKKPADYSLEVKWTRTLLQMRGSHGRHGAGAADRVFAQTLA
jgi:hypothetical protein